MAIELALATAAVIEEGVVLRRANSVDVAPPGYAIRVTWSGVPGATKAEVTRASAEIEPDTIEVPLGVLGVKAGSTTLDVTIPHGRRVRSLALGGLKSGDTALKTSGDFGNRRLVVSVLDGNGQFSPLFAVPSVARRGAIPPSLVGASFEGGALRVPDLAAPKIRLTLVRGDAPESFAADPISVGTITGTAAVSPSNLELIDPSDAAIWSFPNEMPPGTPPATADFRVPLEGALNGALKAGTPLDVTFRLRGDDPGKALVNLTGPDGALLRIFAGALKVEMAGDPTPLPLEGVPLASEVPASATGDLRVRYLGLRLLDTFSDPVPGASGGIGGLIVTDTPTVRAVPPAAFASLPLARVGVIGRAPIDCELSIQLVRLDGGTPGAPIGSPGVARVAPSTRFGTVWVDLPPLPEPPGPLGLSVRANSGRFFWAVGDQPLIRLAVRDPDPGGRPLRLGGQPLMPVTTADAKLPAASLPAGVFRTTIPPLESDLFLTIDLADLTLRYAR